MTIPSPTDAPELVQLKLELANLQIYLQRDLTCPQFEQASAALKEIWKRWSELDTQEAACDTRKIPV